MGARNLTIFISSAEASGDDHAARLVASIRSRLPRARILGLGGPKSAAAGCELIDDLTAHADMLGGPLGKLPYWIRKIRFLTEQVRRIVPDALIPCDSPALNWHLCAAAKSVGSPVMHFICPQVWAWAPWRVRKLRRLSDQVACILPFEERYLRDRGVRAKYVGHPLFDALPPAPDPLPDLAEVWAQGRWRVLLLPGSRKGEIRHHARPLASVAETICRRWSGSECVFSARSAECADLIRRYVDAGSARIEVGRTRELLARSHFAIAASGTVTLEVAHFGVPMVIFYRVGPLLRVVRRAVGRYMIPTPHFSLVNILGGQRVVPEMMPWNGDQRALETMVLEVMNDLGYLFETRRQLLEVAGSLEKPNGQSATDNAADLLLQLLRRKGKL